jgi:predicted CopG family antitoxin
METEKTETEKEVIRKFDEFIERIGGMIEKMKKWRENSENVDLVYRARLFVPVETHFGYLKEKTEFWKEVFLKQGFSEFFMDSLKRMDGALDFLANIFYEVSHDEARKIICDYRKFSRDLLPFFK